MITGEVISINETGILMKQVSWTKVQFKVLVNYLILIGYFSIFLQVRKLMVASKKNALFNDILIFLRFEN